eukprot:gnl/TRDRNA2_/TRDRNA2_182639_c0_seq1.p1 gnl/TRDRNA2_/TRDRNA2_182639_c0~~gnl/TRDRNA2_/TRDRNA2_182639_c0_seq1.p1  ORF type:complete len:313 (-),score=42.37 gnl/TRDRNA2_/TRDRNA2_182639_c0_seq1:303-1241(-)
MTRAMARGKARRRKAKERAKEKAGTDASGVVTKSLAAPMIDICIRSLDGNLVSAFPAPETDTIRHVKQRCGANVFTHMLVHGIHGILQNDMSLSKLEPRYSPVLEEEPRCSPVLELQLVRLPFDEEKGPLLFGPASRGDGISVERLLADTAHPDCDCATDVLRTRATDDTTPLGIAARNGHLQVVRSLIEAGADKDKPRNLSGATALRIAVCHGHLQVVRFLCEAGVEMDKPTLDGTTPLYMAAEKGHLQIVRLLCQAKADKNKTNEYGATPLGIAASKDHLTVAKYLREIEAAQPTEDIRIPWCRWKGKQW